MTTTTTEQTEFTEAPEPTRVGFPKQFVTFNAEYGHAALAKWLEEQKAPAEIIDLAEGLRGVVIFLEDAGEDVSPDYTEAMTDNLIKIAHGMHFTHVRITTPDSIMTA